MSSKFHDLEMQARALTVKEKAALARLLIEELDMTVEADVDQLWVHEAQRRYDAHQKGELEARVGDEVMARVRNRLK
jgi:hypothetical protein